MVFCGFICFGRVRLTVLAESKAEKTDAAPRCCCSSGAAITGISTDEAVVSDSSSGGHHWIIGKIATPVGEIPVVNSELEFADRLGSWKAQCGLGRMNYRVPPGLYAVGQPSAKSPVFVGANYKMSFDRLRSQLGVIDSWILVLDTRGINVWCAAGKGTFGTDEIVGRVTRCRLNEIVEHRRLIVPQLGAPGVAGHRVKELTGFRVIYGPVRAADIPAFLAAGLKATPEMRRVTFPFRDRAALVPVDLLQNAKYPLVAAAVFLLVSGFGPGTYSVERVMAAGLINAVIILAAYFAGTILPPLLLPWLPGRAFAVKGAWIGLVGAMIVAQFGGGHPQLFRSAFALTAWFLLLPAVTSFIAMNFTGASTFTSLSGVLREMRIAVPAQIIAGVGGIGLWLIGLFF